MSYPDDSLFAYGETAGFVSHGASRDRAVAEARSGAFTKRARQILDLLESNPDGLTWRELGARLNLHHGQVSGALSNLHRREMVFMLHKQRDRCHPYVHVKFRDRYRILDRIDHPSTSTANVARRVEKELMDHLLSEATLTGADLKTRALLDQLRQLRGKR